MTGDDVRGLEPSTVHRRPFPSITVYGDFNCPFSALASERVARFEASNSAIVDWRAVQHDTTIGPSGAPVHGERASQLARELEQVRALLADGEVFPIRLPPVLPRTEELNARIARLEPSQACAVRRRLFRALWFNSQDLSSPETTDEIGLPRTANTARASGWQQQWESLDQQVVPTLAVSGDHIGGIDALEAMLQLHGPSK